MNRMLCGIGLAAMCSVGVSADDRVPVTITGCVHAGTTADTYVFTDVKEISEGQSTPATAVYWLSSTKGLADRTGHRVEVAGTYSPSRDAGKTGTVKIDTDGTTGEETIAVENGLKKAEAKSETRPVGTMGVKTEIKRPYRRLEVETIKMIAPACQ